MTRPRLCVPLVTPLRAGHVDVAGLERLLAFHVAAGVDVVFVSGTTGEHPRLSPADRGVLRDAAIARLRGTGVPCWVGVTGATVAETVTLAEAAVAAGADALVLAPLAVTGGFDLTADLPVLPHDIPLYLYENPDLSGGSLLAPAQVLAVADRLAGIKVSAPRAAVEPYLGRLPVWVGYADVWFALAHAPVPPVGVVMGMANALPRAWARALAGDDPALRAAFDAYTAATVFDGRRRTVACAKAGLVELGVLGSAEVLPGTPSLSPAQEATFRAAFRELGLR